MNGLSKPNSDSEVVRLSTVTDFSLGALDVRPSLREVCFAGGHEQLEPRVMQVLVALASAEGAVVSRDDLIRRCWEGRIVGEAAINRCISKLRELSDTGAGAWFRIETIPRVGYRLIRADGALTLPAADEAVAPAANGPTKRMALWVFLGATGLAAAAALFLIVRNHDAVPTPTAAGETSIAVLPFKNLSSDKDAGYLAQGVQDEILTRLAKIGSLRVISRTSADQYANRSGNISDIARELGVANIVEGSVQKSGNIVRINVQLIRASTDDHLWAEDYDRKLDDIFEVESDVAGTIAATLAAEVTPGERREIASRPTTNTRAYDLYLRGLVFAHKNDESSLRTAAQLFTEATAADPNFALAWARLARAQAYLHFGDDLATVRHSAAHNALMKALQLQPDLAEVQAARGFYFYYGEMNYPAAEIELEQVHARWPNNAEALEALALVRRRLGKWQESTDDFARLVALDPLVPVHRVNLAEVLKFRHDFAGAIRVLDDALKIWPDDNWLLSCKAEIYQVMGRLNEAGAILKNIYPAPDFENEFGPVWGQFWLERQYGNGAAFFRGLTAQDPDEPGAEFAELRSGLAEFLRMEGDTKGARQYYIQALDYIQTNLKTRPNDTDLLMLLARIYAGLGDSKMALTSADRVVELTRASGDAFAGTYAADNRARILARVGDRGEATAELERRVKLPGDLTIALLRYDPDFDALRGDKRFQDLLATESKP